MRRHARHTPVDGTAARLARLLRALHACCVPCTLTAAKGAMPLPALGLKGPRASYKAGPPRTMRLRAIQTPADGTAACLAILLRRGRHAVAGAWAEGPSGGLIVIYL
jgi:hypothetical protein